MFCSGKAFMTASSSTYISASPATVFLDLLLLISLTFRFLPFSHTPLRNLKICVTNNIGPGITGGKRRSRRKKKKKKGGYQLFSKQTLTEKWKIKHRVDLRHFVLLTLSLENVFRNNLRPFHVPEHIPSTT